MKKAVKICGILLAVLIIGLVIGYMFLGDIIKTGVETVGPELTKGDIKVESASLIITGSGGIKGLEIGNPKNGDFSSPHAFKLGEAFISVDVGSVTSNKIVVNEIRVDGAELCWEGLTGGNHQKILENIQASAGGSSDSGDTKEDAPSDSGEEKSLEIKLFKMTNTKIRLFGFGNELAAITLPDFEKEGIGSGEDVKMSDSLAILYESMLGSITEFVEASKDVIGDAWEGLSDVGGKAVDTIKEGSKGVVDGLKNLFK